MNMITKLTVTVTVTETVLYLDFASIKFNVDRNHTNVPNSAKE
jgi:hypothetical protein